MYCTAARLQCGTVKIGQCDEHWCFYGTTAPTGAGPSPLFESFDITLRHTTLGNGSSVRVTGPSQRPPPKNAQMSQKRKTSVLPAGFEPAILPSQATMPPMGPVVMIATILHSVMSRRVVW
jgi:hypothetical protein